MGFEQMGRDMLKALRGLHAMKSRKLSIFAGIIVGLVGFTPSAWSQSIDRPASSMAMLEGKLAVDGAIVLQEKGCTNCHSFDNWGGGFGPDLGSNRIRGKTPSALAAAMWNQAPSMWRTFGSDAIPALNQGDAAALYAFFYAQLYFEGLPNTPHGEGIFKGRCVGCHDLKTTAGSRKPGPALDVWHPIQDTVALVTRMWNHSTDMLDQALRQGKSWPRLSGQDTRDLLAYLWKTPSLVPVRSPFRFGDTKSGSDVFNKQCAQCHKLGAAEAGRVDLTGPLRGTTILQFAASMWNHAPDMKRKNAGTKLPTLEESETRDLVTYLVVGRAFDETGNPRAGAEIYRKKNCASCHEDGLVRGAPNLATMKPPFNAVRMTAAVWSHGPAMLEAMRSKKLQWPRFKSEEMLDLLTYLNERSAK
jgi:mono/diheme cytochrome c family protein